MKKFLLLALIATAFVILSCTEPTTTTDDASSTYKPVYPYGEDEEEEDRRIKKIAKLKFLKDIQTYDPAF